MLTLAATFFLGLLIGAFITRQLLKRWVAAVYESREELLKRMTEEFGEQTVERMIGKMIMDLLEDKKKG